MKIACFLQRKSGTREVGSQWIVDLVGDARDEGSHRGQPGRERQLPLQGLPLDLRHLPGGDVLDRADELEGFTPRPALEFAKSVYPPGLAVPPFHDPVLVVESGPAREEVCEVAPHRVPIFRVDETKPVASLSGVGLVDAEDGLECGGIGPAILRDIEVVGSDPGDLLAQEQYPLALPQ